MDHNLVRFKLLMGMLVWSHQAVGVKYHRQLDGIKGRHMFHHSLTDDEMAAGLSFNPVITSNTENEAYAEYTMELYHAYGCHCMPDHAHYIFTGGTGRPQDSVDINCQLLRSCYACEEQKTPTCDAHGTDYSYNLNRGTSVEDSITCTDPKGSCARNVCECDKTFAVNAAVLYTHDLWDHHHHSHNFNRVETCKVKRRGLNPKITHCDRKFSQTTMIADDLDEAHDNDHHEHDLHHFHTSHHHSTANHHNNHGAHHQLGANGVGTHGGVHVDMDHDGHIEFNADTIGHAHDILG